MTIARIRTVISHQNTQVSLHLKMNLAIYSINNRVNLNLRDEESYEFYHDLLVHDDAHEHHDVQFWAKEVAEVSFLL